MGDKLLTETQENISREELNEILKPFKENLMKAKAEFNLHNNIINYKARLSSIIENLDNNIIKQDHEVLLSLKREKEKIYNEISNYYDQVNLALDNYKRITKMIYDEILKQKGDIKKAVLILGDVRDIKSFKEIYDLYVLYYLDDTVRKEDLIKNIKLIKLLNTKIFQNEESMKQIKQNISNFHRQNDINRELGKFKNEIINEIKNLSKPSPRPQPQPPPQQTNAQANTSSSQQPPPPNSTAEEKINYFKSMKQSLSRAYDYALGTTNKKLLVASIVAVAIAVGMGIKYFKKSKECRKLSGDDYYKCELSLLDNVLKELSFKSKECIKTDNPQKCMVEIENEKNKYMMKKKKFEMKLRGI